MIKPAKPRHVDPFYPAVADIETRPDGSVIAIGFGYSYADDMVYKVFDDWGDWLDFIILHCRAMPTIRKVYAHNGGGFDWLSLLEYMVKRGLGESINVIYNDSIVIGVNVKVGRVRIQLRDSLRLLPASLAKLSKTFDTPVQKLGIDCLPHELYERDREMFDAYLKADVQALQLILYRFWLSVVDVVGNIGELPMTLASLSMRLWSMGLKEPMMVPWGEESKAFQREAYFGGRTECFESGTFDVVVHDINSQYPSVMAAREYPISYRGFWCVTYIGEHGIYRGSYSQPNDGLPPLLRDVESGEFKYQGRGTYCMPEIKRLLDLGGTFDCEWGYVFHDIGNPFSEFVNLWWGVRQDAIARGDDGLAFVCKILLNSLYGKFAQKDTGHSCRTATNLEKKDMLAKGTEYYDYGDFIVTDERIQVEHGFVGLAAYITSYARLALYDRMVDAVRAGGKVVYVDTDSIHAVGAELPSSLALGGLKVEYRGSASYAGRKLYVLHDGTAETVKAKGIGKLERGPLDGTHIRQLARDRGASHAVRFGSFPTWREVLLQHKTACRMVQRERTLRNTAPHAIVRASRAGEAVWML